MVTAAKATVLSSGYGYISGQYPTIIYAIGNGVVYTVTS